MNTGATVRTIRVSWVVLLAVLAVGVLSVHGAEAKPNNGTNKASISKRTKYFVEDCEAHGGDADVSYSYDRKGNLESANVSCSGGNLDRVNCTFTVDESSCYSEPKRFPPGATAIRPDVMAPGNAGIQSPETVEGPGLVWSGVGPNSLAGAEATEQPAATPEPAPVRTEAAPMTVQTVDDEPEP